MTKLSKKYALVSTSYYYDGEWKNFYILSKDLTEEDLVTIKFYHDEHMRLWTECYAKERENAKNGVREDLRTDLQAFLNQPISATDRSTIDYYHNLWSEKDLIIEHFEVE